MKGEITFHVGISIADALSKSNRLLSGMLVDAKNGRELTPQETREFLRREQEKGRTMFTGCNNLTEKGSCAGHEKP